MKKLTSLILSAALLLTLCACEGGSASVPVSEPSEAPVSTPEPSEAPVSTPEPSEAPAPMQPTPSPGPLCVNSQEEIAAELKAAIPELRQPRFMDASAVVFNDTPEIDIKNLYYALLRENRAYCYAYDLSASLSEGELSIVISYMPYASGVYPDGFEGEAVGTLKELVCLAEQHLSDESFNIVISDRTLTPDEMNKALQQVGGGYFVCALSRDATAVTITPDAGFAADDCLAILSECDALAQQIADALLSDTMGDAEKARALYGYLTENVSYDRRYYSDKASMSYHSQTAYGALHDNLAICGGYSHALKLLLEKAGIVCYNVSGKCGNEYHMWSIANIDGEWLYFDATHDRGVSPEQWRYCGVGADALSNYSFDADSLNRFVTSA